MPFKVEELMTVLEPLKKPADGAWVVVVGCSPASVGQECPDTQTIKLMRDQPVDFQGTPEGVLDFLYLKQALQAKLAEMVVLESRLSPEKAGKLREFESKLGEQRIEELRQKE
jgi:hypothetical protein